MEAAREAVTDLALFLLVILGAVTLDSMLHLLGHPEWSRHLGYWGTGLIMVSLLHSARKRKIIPFGRAPFFLKLHEFLALLGSMMILAHGGIGTHIFHIVMPVMGARRQRAGFLNPVPSTRVPSSTVLVQAARAESSDQHSQMPRGGSSLSSLKRK
jgi:hypothetical protein